MRLDLHIHSKYSEDGEGEILELAKVVRQKGLDGMAITDHNSIKGSLEALKLKLPNFLVIPGIEISTSKGHLLAYGVKTKIKERLSPEETIDLIMAEGGIAVVPHPFRWRTGIRKKTLQEIRGKVQALEVFNSRGPIYKNNKAAKIAHKYGLGMTGGSDAHFLSDAGDAYTEVPNVNGIDDVIFAIKKGETQGNGEITSLDKILFHSLKTGYLFVKRGFKGI
jgi:hypothetical protein